MDLSGAVESGLVWYAGSRVSVTAGGSTSLFMQNPSDSGRTAYVVSLGVFTGETARVRVSFFKNPTSAAGLVTPMNNNIGNSTTSEMVIRSGAISGGTELSPRAGATARAPFSLPVGAIFIVPPGSSVAMSCARPSGLTGMEDIDMNVGWVEVPV